MGAETITMQTLEDAMVGISDLYPLIDADSPKQSQDGDGVLRTELTNSRFYVLEEE